MATKFTNVLYQLEDSGSTYPLYGVVLYPGVPVEASTLPDAFLVGLLAKRDIARCDAEGNLAPMTRRFAEHFPTDDADDEETTITVADSTLAVTQTPVVAVDDATFSGDADTGTGSFVPNERAAKVPSSVPVAPLVADTPGKTRRGNAFTEG